MKDIMTMSNERKSKWLFGLMFVICLMAYGQHVSAQSLKVVRTNCISEPTDDETALARPSESPRRLPSIKTNWDASKTYKTAVILVSFVDRDFSMENPRATYDSIFNVPGFNKGKGAGCVADYFRDQSNGLFNAQFDIYGPIKVSDSYKSSGSSNYGHSSFRKAAQLVIDSLHVDFSQYDWDGDNVVEQVVFVYAGYGGNESAEVCTGCIWPNTSTFSRLTAGNVQVYNYTASAELWSNDALCGIGTICHEFSHSLGLPDLYPTGKNSIEYAVVDYWDLMDGGNFINSGWCPCNYSAFERIQLGWLTAVELTEPTSIVDLKPISDGGEAYLIRHTDNEYYLLENRQWTKWDLRTPGQGLLVAHVDYDASKWSSNTVNNTPSHHRYDYVHADNLTYNDWDNIIGSGNPYSKGHSLLLSGTPYPCINDSVSNDSLTDSSLPASVMFNANVQGSYFLSKAITNIRMSDDGLLSFDFMGGTPSAISEVELSGRRASDAIYDLQGRKVLQPKKNGIYIKNGRRIIY